MNTNLTPIPIDQLVKSGVLPIIKSPVQFAFGPPDGITSNSWKIKGSKKGDIYILCRDNFKEAKVSLHPGKIGDKSWRFAYTNEAINEDPERFKNIDNRVWQEWGPPREQSPGVTLAFHLYFLKSELGVKQEQRKGKNWKNTIYINMPPDGTMGVVSIFITEGNLNLKHENQPSFLIGVLPIGNNRFAQILVHSEPVADFPEFIENHVDAIRKQAQKEGVLIPKEGFCYLLGKNDNGARFITGARAYPAENLTSSLDV